MSVARRTAAAMTTVLVEEVGVEAALRIVVRLLAEVPGNQSYRDSLYLVLGKLKLRRDE